jgi:hypothetical protein
LKKRIHLAAGHASRRRLALIKFDASRELLEAAEV